MLAKIKIYQLLPLMFLGLFINSCKTTSKLISSNESVFYTDSIYSKSLNEVRKHYVYLPKGFDNQKQYPIIYATDGGCELTEKKHDLDSLIENKLIRPCIFIASYSNDKIADSTSMTLGNGQKVKLSFRNFEYVKEQYISDSLLKNRFINHMSYFSEELIPYVEKQFKQSPTKENRFFYGVSNGAGFGLNLLSEKPELIGTYLCFSPFGTNPEDINWNSKITYPNLYFTYGSNEPKFLSENAEIIKEKYSKSNSKIFICEFTGGHNDKFWSIDFNKYLTIVLKQ